MPDLYGVVDGDGKHWAYDPGANTMAPTDVHGAPALAPAGMRRGLSREDGHHARHVTHGHEAHPGGIECSCGATLGVTCFVLPDGAWDGTWEPAPCPDCAYWRQKHLARLVWAMKTATASGGVSADA